MFPTTKDPRRRAKRHHTIRLFLRHFVTIEGILTRTEWAYTRMVTGYHSRSVMPFTNVSYLPSA